MVEAQALLLVFNKADLVDESVLNHRFELPGRAKSVSTSATAGTGITELVEGIASQLVGQLPPPELLIPISLAQCERLNKARELSLANEPMLAGKMLGGDG
jgi:50S ribosomal subunit-associated GTPase HflX